jgi:hypothetical protein
MSQRKLQKFFVTEPVPQQLFESVARFHTGHPGARTRPVP